MQHDQNVQEIQAPMQLSQPEMNVMCPNYDLQIQFEKQTLLLAKKESEIVVCKNSIQKLNDRIGCEEIGEETLKLYEGILLSDGEAANGSDNDSHDTSDDNETSGRADPGNSSNKENIEPNINNRKQIDMNFSFSHEFTLNVKILHILEFHSILFHVLMFLIGNRCASLSRS